MARSTGEAGATSVAGISSPSLLSRRPLERLGRLRFRAVAEKALSRPWLILILCFLAAAVSGYGVRWLTFNPDSRLFFGKDDPERVALEAMENTFSKANNIVFVLAPKDGEVFTRTTLSAIRWLTEQAWKTPFSTRVYSITNEQHSFAKGDDVVVEDLVPDPSVMDREALQRARRIALDRSDLVNQMISAKADVTSVMVLVTAPGESRSEVPTMAGFAKTLAAEFEDRYPDIDLYLTGGVIGDEAFAEAGQRDTERLVPLMAALVAITLLIGLRSFFAMLSTLAAILLSLLTTMGLAGWSGLVLNPATASAPVVIMVLSLATGVHIVASANREAARGLDRRAATLASLDENAFPVFVNNLTTVIGFLALGFSIAPPLQELGNLVSGGTVIALIYSFTFLPAAMMVLPMSARPEVAMPGLRRVLRQLADFVIAHRQGVMIASSVALLGLGAGMTKLTFDDDFIRYFDESYSFRADTDFMQQRLTGLHVLQYAIPSGEQGGVLLPDYLEKLDSFAEWFKQQPKVTHVSSVTDLFKRLHKNMNGDDPAFYRLPEQRDLAAQYLLFYELSLPFGHDLGSRIDIGRSTTKLTVVLANVSMDELRELGSRGEAWLAEHAPEFAAPVSGLSIMYAYLSERNVWGMLAGTAIGLVVISAMLMAVLRSLSIGLLSLIPNFFPAFMAFGLWGYFQGEVNLAVSVVAVTTFGIVVDDTVHLLSHYLHARRTLALGPEDAIRYCYDMSGVPCLLTTIALASGFLVMAMSGFAVTSQMGLLSAMTIIIAWFGDYFCLPPLLMMFGRKT